jgi:translation elongation factor P/translation initiation factor 5A
MSKKALGKGVAALFPTEMHELEDKSSNLKVISDNHQTETANLEVKSTNLLYFPSFSS